jgi:glycosyltransferase 2 family protein
VPSREPDRLNLPASDRSAVDEGFDLKRPFSRIFASSPDETRVRRAADRVVLALALVTVGLAAWRSDDEGTLGRWVNDIFTGAPEWVRSIAGAVFVAGGIVVLAIVVLVVWRSRWGLVRDTVVAVFVAVAGAVVLARWVSGSWPELFPEITRGDGAPAYPVVRIALTVAVLVTVRPSLTVPVRRFEQWTIALTVVSAMVLEFATFAGAIGGVALGVAAAALVRLVFGTSVGIPTLDRIAAALADLHTDVRDLAYTTEQSRGSLLVRANDDIGPISIRVYGRDAADSAIAARIWRAMWYRDESWSVGVSRQQLAGHEALMLLMARRSGLDVPDVVAAGPTSTGDVLLVTRDEHRMALGELDAVDDELLDDVWRELARLHAANLSHGRLAPANVTIGAGSRVGFRDLANASMSSTGRVRLLDLVAMLVTTALLVGNDRAVAAACRAVDGTDLAGALTLLQPAALPRDLAVAVRGADLDLAELRGVAAAALGVDVPEPVNLRRVRVRDAVMVVLALVVANVLISWVTSIDLDTLVDELAGASIGWLLFALVLSQLTNVAETVSMKGVVSQPLPFGPTMQFQYATSYVGLAVPSDAGRVAMTIRYLQKLGVPTRVAMGQGPFTTVFGYVIDFLLLIITMWMVGAEIDLPDDADFSGFITLVIVLGGLVVAGIVAVLAVPRLRRRILPEIAETLRELKGSLTDPSRASKLLGGIIARKLLFALTMASVLTAFGEPLPLATVIFVNTAVSWFAGVFPVPGGIGVAEAGFVVGLTAFGVPESVALATALTHRLLTTYLPPVVGFFMMRRLERAGYL